MIGITGAGASYSILSTPPGAAVTEMDATPESAEAAAAFVEEVLLSRKAQGIAVANLLASGLLFFASLLLTTRRRSALWWARQATIANMLYAVGSTIAVGWLLHENHDVVAAMLTADANSRGLPEAEAAGAWGPTVWTATWLGWSLVMLGVYAIMYRASLREDIQRFLTGQAHA